MGQCNFGAPREAIIFLMKAFSSQHFIETGTFKGETAKWAASIFKNVSTIEGMPELYEAAKTRLSPFKNVQCFLGDSKTTLKEILKQQPGMNPIFWLDAHWMPGCYGHDAECPALDEIQLIREMAPNSIVLIDDARLFLSPPPLPHKASDWPDIKQIILTIDNSSKDANRYIVVFEDVIYSIPTTLTDVARSFFQNQITKKHNQPPPPEDTPLQKIARRFLFSNKI
jgi:hypothetical protein